METKAPEGHRLREVGENITTGDLCKLGGRWRPCEIQTEDNIEVGEGYPPYATPLTIADHKFPVDTLEFQSEPKQLTEHEQIQLDRGLIYGDPYHNHASIGKIWTGLLEQHYGLTLPHIIPPSLVALLMAGLKINRMNRVWQKDNADDGQIYIKFASSFQERDNEKRKVQLKEQEVDVPPNNTP